MFTFRLPRTLNWVKSGEREARVVTSEHSNIAEATVGSLSIHKRGMN